MIIKEIKATGFRNLKPLEFKPDNKMNVIFGDNAQGKTNLIEAIYLFTGLRSFRGAKEKELIGFNEKTADIEMIFETNREQNVKIHFGQSKKDKKIELNGVNLKGNSELFGKFRCVLFSPDYLNFIKGSPEIRRRFLDSAVAQIRVNYLKTLQTYNKLLLQRNNIIKNYTKYENLEETLYPWDTGLAKAGAYITVLRLDYLKKLKIAAKEYYQGMSGGKEEFNFTYNSSILSKYDKPIEYNADLISYYYERQKAMTKVDIKLGYTLNGIHRDDLVITLDGKPVKTYGSQGQQRSCVLALKLSESYILDYAFDDKPIMLLDDVFSELDTKRQNFLLNNINGIQTIITCCDINNTKQLKKGKIFEMKDGVLK